MKALKRRVVRLEQKGSSACVLWCCATEADASALITRLRSECSPTPLVFIAGKPNSDGSSCWRIEGRTVADLWRAIDSLSPALPLGKVDATPNPRFEAMTDEQLLGVITEGGATLVVYQDGKYRLEGVP